MINFIPIFPLNIVVFPNEELNLHIFEPRYIQLINECIEQDKPFGIPVVLNNAISEHGTLIKVSKLVKRYHDGKMDITVKGKSVFRILEIVKEIPEKMYYGAIVNYPKNENKTNHRLLPNIISAVKQLHQLAKIKKDFHKEVHEMSSYDVAHHVGLSIDEEYELLQLLREDQRLEYLKRHLQKTVTVILNIESMKKKIKLNGHFKELKGFTFDF